MREITGATIRQKGGPFQVEKLFLDEPRPDEVLVRVVATGMCHTDMVARDQLYVCRYRSCSGMKARAWLKKWAAV
jgi:aryl-alcohol dehydrogenase